jgi:hypothetical protein
VFMIWSLRQTETEVFLKVINLLHEASKPKQ